jgi:hypothetical protein
VPNGFAPASMPSTVHHQKWATVAHFVYFTIQCSGTFFSSLLQCIQPAIGGTFIIRFEKVFFAAIRAKLGIYYFDSRSTH